MDNMDLQIKQRADSEKEPVPDFFARGIEKGLNSLPETRVDKIKVAFRLNKKLFIAACLVFTILTVSGAGIVNRIYEKSKYNMYAAMGKLPTVGSRSNLERLVKKAYPKRSFLYGFSGKKSDDSTAGAVSERGSGVDHSTTNVQVEGVDEGDTVKTDGEFIYKISGRDNYNLNSIQIIRAYPAETMTMVSKISYEDIQPEELFLKENLLVVVGRGMNTGQNIGYRGSTVVYIYDIKDKANPTLVRQFSEDGSYVTGRVTEGNLYVISNKYIDKGVLSNGNEELLLPRYKDSIKTEDIQSIPYKDINYCPEAIEPNFILIASINLNKLSEEVSVSAFLGSAKNIFCSQDSLYIAGYNYTGSSRYNTKIYKFGLKSGKVSYIGAGEVPGNVLNQFSMDEYNGFFRVTTTSTAPGKESKTKTSVNNVYILDGSMKIAGKLENLAEGERIYSTRFMREKAYMVTFKNTDPLYVIDVRNPYSPKVLGELKIPGFSNYLHPYDENHIIGFGKDAEVVSTEYGETAYQQGMKLAIFDVSDVKNPKQMFMTTIGDRGTDSELLRNHKALLFSKDKGLLAFPITVAKLPENISKDTKEYGQVNFVGAYVFGVDLKNGFSLKGSITHYNGDMNSETKYYAQEIITRVIYIGDNIYTISNAEVRANKMNTLQEVKVLNTK